MNEILKDTDYTFLIFYVCISFVDARAMITYFDFDFILHLQVTRSKLTMMQFLYFYDYIAESIPNIISVLELDRSLLRLISTMAEADDNPF